jgi:hypothetical protein
MANLAKISKVVPDAYHGTTKAAWADIQINGFRLGDRGWLGRGVYFYEGAPQDAEKWAKRTNPPDQVAVLRATIILGHCLDLHNPVHVELMGEYHRKLVEEIRRRRLTDHGKAIKVTEPLVLDFMAQNMELDAVRVAHATRAAKEPVFPGSRFRKGHQIIICVRNLANIRNVRLM